VQAGAENRTEQNRVKLGRGADTNPEILTNTIKHSRSHMCEWLTKIQANKSPHTRWGHQSHATNARAEERGTGAGAGSQSLSLYIPATAYIRLINSISQKAFI